jgi:DNA-binding MarR family transcriptional regulator
MGLTGNEIARQLLLSKSAVSKMIRREETKNYSK